MFIFFYNPSPFEEILLTQCQKTELERVKSFLAKKDLSTFADNFIKEGFNLSTLLDLNETDINEIPDSIGLKSGEKMRLKQLLRQVNQDKKVAEVEAKEIKPATPESMPQPAPVNENENENQAEVQAEVEAEAEAEAEAEVPKSESTSNAPSDVKSDLEPEEEREKSKKKDAENSPISCSSNSNFGNNKNHSSGYLSPARSSMTSPSQTSSCSNSSNSIPEGQQPLKGKRAATDAPAQEPPEKKVFFMMKDTKKGKAGESENETEAEKAQNCDV